MDYNKQAKKLTGSFEMGLSSNTSHKGNSEIEGGEYTKDNNGNIKEVIGKKHSQGGVKVLLQDGERVLTDYDKIPEKLATKIKDNLGIRVSKRDTYSTVLDKYNKKIGFDKVVAEEEKLNKRILEQKDPNIDGVTRQLNLQALSSKLSEIKKEKQPLKEQQVQLFDILFADQENRKIFDNMKQTMFQKGGQGRDFFSTIIPEWYKGDDFWERQKRNEPGGSYGANMEERDVDMMDHIKTNMPGIFEDVVSKGVDPENTEAFQRAYNEKVIGEALTDVADQYGKDSDQYRRFSSEANKYLFTNDGSVNSIDGKFGNRTSSRAAFSLNLLPRDVLMELNNAGIKTSGQLRKNEKYKDIYDKYVGGRSDHWVLGHLNEEAISGTPAPMGLNNKFSQPNIINRGSSDYKIPPSDPREPSVKDPKVKGQLKEGESALNLLTLFPDSDIRKPGPVLPHLKIQNYLQQSYTPEATAHEGTREINRSRMASENSFRNLDPQTRALAALGMNSQVTDSITKLHTGVGDTNAKMRSADATQNMGMRNQFQQRQNASAMDYEQKTYKAMDNNEQNWRRFFGDKAKDRRMKWNSINKLNANNALNPDVQNVNGRYRVRKSKFDENLFRNFMATEEGRKIMEAEINKQYKTKSKR